ncbi:Transcriptional regulator, Crp/Fnr family [Thermobacillus xylanilyticus]|uniref:cAMP-binding protein n=2 Tax=Thermobacillus TaxID=76632 RepID=L0EHS9_THECK|nr:MULTISPECIES: Crp/Fnr family transcriptional regulator [Thermobacillus]AGA59199.1 cAMP-binding protein [Thermobacillus composti KWC4]CAG5081691.1 Transcriptional regulator, Crp/Fnr family [Thermobacillus xylanilyticus]
MSIDAARLRSAIPFFREMDPEVTESLAPYLTERTFKKGTVIFVEGDEGDDVYFIRSGAVQIYTFDGTKKVMLAYLRDGDYFGEMAMMKPGAQRSASAEAAQLTKVYALKRNVFERLILDHPRLALYLLDDTMERLRKANQQIYDLTFLNVRTRIMKRLLRLAQENGTETPEGLLIGIKVTHQQIAEMVGAVRETVTKVFNELQEEGLIVIRQKMILLPNPELLVKRLQEEN